MTAAFYICAGVALVSTAMVVTRLNAVHALLYMIVSLLAVALLFFMIGAPFVAALQVIIYAGGIMALFVFAIMILNLGGGGGDQDSARASPAAWLGPGVLCAVLLIELLWMSMRHVEGGLTGAEIGPAPVAETLFTRYVLGVELASIVLLSGLIGAYHLGRRRTFGDKDESE